jgi:hypothetical protein
MRSMQLCVRRHFFKVAQAWINTPQQASALTVQILCAMRTGPVRLSELKREIPSASKKALTSSLRSLEAGDTLRSSFGMGNLECGYNANIQARRAASAT